MGLHLVMLGKKLSTGATIVVLLLVLGIIGGLTAVQIHLTTQGGVEGGCNFAGSLIGFTAFGSLNLDTQRDRTVKFPAVLIDGGSYYSPVSGKFVCPTPGVYLVTGALRRNGEENLDVGIYHGSETFTTEVLHASQNNENNPDVTVAFTTLVKCKTSEWIAMEGQETPGSIYGDPNAPFSTFSVILLHIIGVTQVELIGSSAWKTVAQSYNLGDLVTFDGINYNGKDHFQGIDHYSIATNTFTCPTAGVYFVDVGCAKADDVLNVVVVHDQQTVLHISDASESNNGLKLSNNGLVLCNPGEKIFVRGKETGKTGDGLKSSTFTVFQVNKNVPNFVGASVYKDSIQEYHDDDVIDFGGTLFNDNGFFKATSSQFICSVAGVYYVTLNMKRNEASAMVVYVAHSTGKNVNTVLYVDEAREENPGNVISNSATFHAKSGDALTVKAGGRGAAFGHSAQRHTTFTVFLLSEDAG